MTPFEQPAALAINKARLEHLGSLGLPLEWQKVLEVGAGIGLLTSFFEDRNCWILSTDGRPENIKAIRDTFPLRDIDLFDLNQEDDYCRQDKVDIVFCYGTLYHTSDPAYVLRNLARLCYKLLLLETIVWPIDDGYDHLINENVALSDQSLDGYGCRPARDWLWKILTGLFPYVYVPRTQPNHPEFPLSWPVSPNNNTRAVFITSRLPLDLPTLTDTLPEKYESLSI